MPRECQLDPDHEPLRADGCPACEAGEEHVHRIQAPDAARPRPPRPT